MRYARHVSSVQESELNTVGLGWVGINRFSPKGWVGSGKVGLGWVWSDEVCFGQIGLGLVGLGWDQQVASNGLGWFRQCWVGSDRVRQSWVGSGWVRSVKVRSCQVMSAAIKLQ